MDVHLVEHAGPVLGLEAALAGVHREDGVALVELAGEPGLDLQLIEQRRQLGGGALGLLGEGRIVAGQLARRRRVVQKTAGPLVVLDGGAKPRRLLRDRLGRRRVVPKVRTGRLLVQRDQLVALLVDTQEREGIGQPTLRLLDLLLNISQFHALI